MSSFVFTVVYTPETALPWQSGSDSPLAHLPQAGVTCGGAVSFGIYMGAGDQ